MEKTVLSTYGDISPEMSLTEKLGLLVDKLRNDEIDNTIELRDHLDALRHLSNGRLQAQNIKVECENMFGEQLWLDVVNSTMANFPEDLEIQEAAISCLLSLLEQCPTNVCQFIGEDQGQYPLLDHVTVALKKHTSIVFHDVCKVIALMAENCEILQQEFIMKRVHEAIEIQMSLSDDPSIQCCGYTALTGLARANMEFKKHLLANDILNNIVNTLETNPNTPYVQENAVILLATLASDLEVARQQCIIEEIPLILLGLLKLCSHEETLVEVTLEALGVLCSSDGVPDILRKSDGLRLTLAVMKDHSKNTAVQKKGIVLLQLLVTNHKLPENTLTLLADVIKEAMTSCCDDADIQSEACVILHLMCENDIELGQKLVRLNIHEHFFKLFENFPENECVLDVVSQCLYLLACVHDLKNPMLLSMCALGSYKAVECLIHLGANVNCGEGINTPLCLACMSNNLELVNYLLTQGVADVHNALELCLESRRHSIAGFLLKHMGHDVEAGTITLTGLNLQSVRSEWLEPAFIGNAACLLSISCNQWWEFVERARYSRIVRRRLGSSVTSDDEFGSLESLRKISFQDEDNIFELPSPTPPPILIPRATPSPSERSTDSHDRYHFSSLSTARLRTLTGGSIPYSCGDPRLVVTPTYHTPRNVITPESCALEEKSLIDDENSEDSSVHDEKIPKWYIPKWNNPSSNFTPSSIPEVPSENSFDSKSTAHKTLKKSTSMLQRRSVFSQKNDMRKCRSGSALEISKNEATSPNPVHRLDLSFNQITSVEILARKSGILSTHLKSIEKLDLSNNRLEHLPSDLGSALPRLKCLTLKHNLFRLIPLCVFSSSSLEWLDLSHNKISKVEEPKPLISSLVSHLNLSNNSIREFPDWLGNAFGCLTSIDFSYNLLETINNRTINLRKLKSLNLSDNSLTKIPSHFMENMVDLEVFKAGHNELKYLPDNVAPHLVKLTIVKLPNNKLKEKQPFYCTKFVLLLPNVHTVNLSDNNLCSVASPSNWTSQNLKDLDLSHNRITYLDLSKGVTRWSFMNRLDLSYNQLKQVPKGIGQLKNLGQLNLSGNNGISQLPDEMGNLGRLYELLHSDMRLALNASLLRGRTRDLVAHLQAKLRNSASCPQRKLVVAGPKGSGKTTLLRLLATNKSLKKVNVTDKRKTKISENLHIQKWLMADVKADCRCCSRKNVTLTLRVWEFPGAGTSVTVHRCFLTESDLHLLVYDVSAGSGEIENLKPWLANIYDQCQNAGVLLVGTHLDKVHAPQQKALLKQVSEQVKKIHVATGYPEIRGHFVVNCLQNGTRVNEFLRRLLNHAMALNTKGYDIQDHRVPKSFIKLQEILESKINSINDPMGVVNIEFITKCASESKLDVNKDIFNEAVAFLRQSGLLVNYSRPVNGLQELFFLWPAKLATLIAHVVHLFQLSDKDNGLIEREELVAIIVKEGCPESIFPQILRLLEHFEIVLPVTQYTYLVTSGLSKEPVTKLTRTPELRYLRRRYIMSYLPVGFWARLVVYLLHQSEELIDVQQQTITQQHRTVSCTFWENGFSGHWSNDCNFSIEKLESTLEIVVPSNMNGHILLGNLVYHIDALIQEWFPALCGVDALNSSPMIRKTTFCLTCQEHQFLLEDCAIKARSESFIQCPKDNDERLLLRAQVPDVMLSHIDQRYLIKKDELKYYESQETILGEGSFGSVYKAKYKDKVVAAKVFKPQTDFESGLEYLEQEVRFLARLRHPSIIDLIGMCLRPVPIAVLELAPLGSLNAIFRRYQTLSRGIQHRIAMQVAEGLAFLHNQAIVYRDLKPHNILIFSLAAGTLINAKISDFGSCRYAMPFGFIAKDGTPGYRAPEVARGDVEYNEKADIFSLGMLLYELATGGKQPFENLKFRSELDEAVINGRPVDPIIMADSPPWPDMQDLLDNMLVLNPDNRPTAQQVYERLSGPEFISLKNDIAVCKGQAVECMAVRCYSEEERCKMEVWVGSGASDWSDFKKKDGETGEENIHTSQLSRFNLSSSKPKGCKGTILPDGRILAILCVGEKLILVGTQTGNLWVYDAGKEEICHAMPRLPDAVLCLRHSCVDQRDLVFAGLADGKLAVYKTTDFYTSPQRTTQIIIIDAQLCCHDLPLLSMTIARKKLYCASGHNVVSIRLDKLDLIPEGSWSVNEEASGHKGVVSIIIVDKKGLWCCMKGSSRIQLWDLKTRELRARFNCEDLVSYQQSARELRVVSILIHNNVLWIGTGGGQILLVDTNSMSLLMTMLRHKSAVRCLTTAVLKEGGKPISMVLSGGLGFVARESSSRAPYTSDFGYVLVWDSGIHEESKELQEYKTRRNEWLLNNTNR